ncbi:DgyrCDS13424 [Dimorphilus gyrociliatus]|uniref:DgyrCDS13424 n=1 Tax=Dimorphilus gyrociliatus TaxID=2664684 RepID=A0A7I8WAL2_9ANNE|nr:DgyrCDS13424 [Dimorphilus gyrociliatus]
MANDGKWHGADDAWLRIQVTTFSNWVNEQLRINSADESFLVQNLEKDLCNGVRLCELVSFLTRGKIGRIVKRPNNQHQKLENVTLALRAITRDGVKLVNIGSEDVVNGNVKLILALIWHLILRYQIWTGKTTPTTGKRSPPKKLMLAWLNAVLPECRIANLSTDWNDGIFLHALIDWCSPGASPDWRHLSRNDKIKNCKTALDLAHDLFRIPKVLTPEHMASVDLDELSGMTYLSYFMKANSAGYDQTLKWVRNQMPTKHVNNFTSDWIDGILLRSLVVRFGGSPPDLGEDNVANLQAVMTEARVSLGIEPVIPAKEMADPDVDHLGVMAYIAWFMNVRKSGVNTNGLVKHEMIQKTSTASLESLPRPSIKANAVQLTQYNREVHGGRPVDFTLRLMEGNSTADVRVEIIGPNTRPKAMVNWTGKYGQGQFVPSEPGTHQIRVLNGNEVITGCPAPVLVKLSAVSKANGVQLTSFNKDAITKRPSEFTLKIIDESVRASDVSVEIVGNSSPIAAVNWIGNQGRGTFTPTESGQHQIRVLNDGELISGCPALVWVKAQISKDSAVQLVSYNKEIQLGLPVEYSVKIIDDSVPTYDVSVDIVGPTIPVSSPINWTGKFGRGSFMPTESGQYQLKVMNNGEAIAGCPVFIRVKMRAASAVSLIADEYTSVGEQANFRLEALDKSVDPSKVQAEIISPTGTKPDINIRWKNNQAECYFVPLEPGQHQIYARHDGFLVNNSPGYVNVKYPAQKAIVVKQIDAVKHLGEIVNFQVESLDDQFSSSDVRIDIRGPNTNPKPQLVWAGRYCRGNFEPLEVGPHEVVVSHKGFPIEDSPKSVDVKVIPSRSARILNVSQRSIVGQAIKVEVAAEPGIDKRQMRCEIVTPNSRSYARHITWKDNIGECSFVPDVSGDHSVLVSNGKFILEGCPINVPVLADPSRVRLAYCEKTCALGSQHELRIDSSNAGKGDLRVLAKAPSGQTIEGSIKEYDGVFTSNFIPTEIGDWLISILYNGKDLEGSPFSIRVFDVNRVVISGLEGGVAGRSFSFTADCSNAGEGNLLVEVTHRGNPIPTQIERESRGVYKATFTPHGSGLYSIKALFANLPIRGSPFTLEIVDASKIEVSGDGLKSSALGNVANFFIYADSPGTKLSDLKVDITSPSGSSVPSKINNQSSGVYKVEYLPKQVGEHLIEILFMNRPISNGPFRMQAFDASSIVIKNLTSFGLIGRPIEFDIDASLAGSGNLEIMVNDGSVKCAAQSRGNKQFHAAFVPLEGGTYVVRMKFNGVELRGSPWNIDVKSAQRVHASGRGLSGPISCHQIASFDVDCGLNNNGTVTANVTSPTGRILPIQSSPIGSGISRLTYTPLEPGSHTIDVKFEGIIIPGSPFTAKAYDASAIQIGEASIAVVGKPVEMTVDVSSAGEGPLEITVNNGQVQNTVKPAAAGRKGLFVLSFVPRTSTPHIVDVTFNGERAPRCPLTIPVLDTGRVVARGQGLENCTVNKPAMFHVDTTAAGEADLEVIVFGPNDQKLSIDTNGSYSGGFEVVYVAQEVGKHQIIILYCGTEIRGSPFTARCSDPSKIFVSEIHDGFVGRKSSLLVDANGAGEGNLQIAIGVVSGKNIQNHVQQIGSGKFEVTYTPLEGALHEASVTFNSFHVKGSPFKFNVLDISRVSVSGDGIGLVKCREETYFRLNMPSTGFNKSMLDVMVMDYESRKLPIKIKEVDEHDFLVFYTPLELGIHNLYLKITDQDVNGSPFQSKAYDPSKVTVNPVHKGNVGEKLTAIIDPSNAGAGQLAIKVTVDNKNVPNVPMYGKDHKINVSFTPEKAMDHLMHVSFNGYAVPGSPFVTKITDSSEVTAHGDGLGLASVQKKTSFFVVSSSMGDNSELDVEIKSPSGRKLNPLPSPTDSSGWKIEYIPQEVGMHEVSIKLNGREIADSPFHPEIYDCRLVKVSSIGPGNVGKPVAFQVDCQTAGIGTITVDIRAEDQARAISQVEQVGDFVYEVIFVPKDRTPHTIAIHFNKEEVEGSPFICPIVDSSLIRIDWDRVRSIPVDKEVVFNVDIPPSGSMSEIEVEVVDPSSKEVHYELEKRNSVLIPKFIPRTIGNYTIIVTCSGQPVAGCPFTCTAYDVSKVKVIDVDSGGKLDDKLGFTVDTSKAGSGDIDVEVYCEKQLVRTVREKLSNTEHRYHYIVQRPYEHTINVFFNLEQVPGCPKTVPMALLDQVLMLDSSSPTTFEINQLASATLIKQGQVSLDESQVSIKAPNGEMIPAKVVELPNGNFKVEYTSIYTGEHVVEALYAGIHVAGTPFKVQIFDPNKIHVQLPESLLVGERAEIGIVTANAGSAELNLTITSPKNENIPYDLNKNDKGFTANFMPFESGTFKAYITYGGLDVPGCPLPIHVSESSNNFVNVVGEGLFNGVEGRPSTFVVEGKGNRSQLAVQVDGPNSVAKCHVEPESDDKYKVTYVPVEVGQYFVVVKWNGQNVPGGPWRPQIISPSKVAVIGGWQSHMDSKSRIALVVNEMKRIEFDTTTAGIGNLSGEVRGPTGSIPVEARSLGSNRHLLAFTPQVAGEHYLNVSWGGVDLPDSPLAGYALPERHMSADGIEKVILTGSGLQNARVREEAEFVIDGSQAGPGAPDVKIVGLKVHVNVAITPIGEDKFRCTYIPEQPGAYLLNVKWGDKDVKGSPFKISVSAQADPNKVFCLNETLRTAIYGKDISTIIDTKKAGPGELQAQCTGPYKIAFCELLDQENGTFKLKIKPQETGKHTLQIKYAGQHIPGSPFEIKVQGAPDPSKVRVVGPGIEHGMLATFKSRFVVETKGAGAGQLTVRVRGPKAAFRVEMKKESQMDRTILCRYDPTEIGDYTIAIKWSGYDVPGSPFLVRIFDSIEELERYKLDHPNDIGNPNTLARSNWTAEM